MLVVLLLLVLLLLVVLLFVCDWFMYLCVWGAAHGLSLSARGIRCHCCLCVYGLSCLFVCVVVVYGGIALLCEVLCL